MIILSACIYTIYLFDFQAIALAPVRLYLQHAISFYNRFYASYKSIEL
nr:MAG TPA: hypothetical protein [Bacteriophage sp.]